MTWKTDQRISTIVSNGGHDAQGAILKTQANQQQPTGSLALMSLLMN